MRTLLVTCFACLVMACQNQNAETVAEKQHNEPMACPKDIKVCEDGQKVGRDGHNQCEFFACPEPLKKSECKNEMKQCKDGTFVYPNPGKECAFDPCPEDKLTEVDHDPILKACTKDLKVCENGITVGRDPANNCEFHACDKKVSKEPVMCTQEVKQCPDGSYVGRDSYNNCAFKLCPDGKPPSNPKK